MSILNPKGPPYLVTVRGIDTPGLVGHETNILGDIALRVANLQDAVVREQLIKAGWTPPTAKAESDLVLQLVAAARRDSLTWEDRVAIGRAIVIIQGAKK